MGQGSTTPTAGCFTACQNPSSSLRVLQAEGASMLLIGPGVGGNGPLDRHGEGFVRHAAAGTVRDIEKTV